MLSPVQDMTGKDQGGTSTNKGPAGSTKAKKEKPLTIVQAKVKTLSTNGRCNLLQKIGMA